MRALAFAPIAAAVAIAAAAPVQAAPLATPPIPAAVERALAAAGALPGARVEIVSYRGPARCNALRAEADQLIASSGSVALHIEGRGPAGESCRGLGLAEARLFAPVWIASRALATGEALDGAAARAVREVKQGHAPLAEIPAGSAATRRLAAGTVLEAPLVQDPTWLPGQNVRVVLHTGALSLTQQGRIVTCAPGRACAVLPSGRRVEGTRSNGELILENR